jgi:hypothetical protein
MEIVVLSGGLGNQMFQYSFYLSKKLFNNNVIINDYSVFRESTHNGYELFHVFNISVPKKILISAIVSIIRKLLIFKNKKYFSSISSFMLTIINLLGVQIVCENESGIFNQEKIYKKKGFCLYFGFWQSEKYFLPIEKEIRNAFSFNLNFISNRTSKILDEINSIESISIHIRRGDYLSKKYENIYNNICSSSYYKLAISKIFDSVVSPVFFVFSDDITWVKNNMDIPNAFFIDWNQGKDSWQDMFLISKCKHNIIANSTFSWWGAWLNEYPDKIVIAPKKFINNLATPDLIPENWIVL